VTRGAASDVYNYFPLRTTILPELQCSLLGAPRHQLPRCRVSCSATPSNDTARRFLIGADIAVSGASVMSRTSSSALASAMMLLIASIFLYMSERFWRVSAILLSEGQLEWAVCGLEMHGPGPITITAPQP
jgi:hypothetical protein